MSTPSPDRLDDVTTVETPTRALHFVGSLPDELHPDDHTGMQWILGQAGPIPLTALPCDRHANWVVRWLFDLAERPTLEPVRDGDASGYHDYPHYRVTPGLRLAPEDVSLHRISDTTAAMAARRSLDTLGELPPLQVSIPNPLDLAYFCFGAALPLVTNLRVFRQAILDDVTTIHERYGDEVVFQLETPASLIALDKAPRGLARAVARYVADQITRLITDAPQEALWILHLCYGDLNHQPVIEPHDLAPAVRIITAVHRRLSLLGETIPRVHIPMCTGTTGPSTDAAFYRPLGRLPNDVEVIAGLVDELNPHDSHRALDLAENALGRPMHAVSAACGHGRRTATATTANAALARALAAAPHRRFAPHHRPGRTT